MHVKVRSGLEQSRVISGQNGIGKRREGGGDYYEVHGMYKIRANF